MRRTHAALISIVGIVTTALAASAIVAPAASAAPKARPGTAVGSVIPPQMFGMHVFNAQDGVWPTIPIGALRLWDNETTWNAIETADNQFNWAKLDAAVANAEKNGVRDILMVLAGTPAWSTDDPASGGQAGVQPGGAGMPRDLASWDDWVTQVATRYKGRINAYQPWNEANLPTFSTGSPAEMAELTKRAYDIVKRIDPKATVVAPSTGTRLSGAFMKFYPKYLKELAKRGWPVDVWAAHTYPASLGTPVDRAKLARDYKAVLAAAGAPAKPIWDTENNFGLKGPGPMNPDVDIEGPKAGQWLARTYLDGLRLGIDRTYWYAWAPPGDLLGIQMFNGTVAATAYATMEKWLVGATYRGCKTKGREVTCSFTRNGQPFQIVYTENGKPATFTLASAFPQACALDGTCVPLGTKKVRTAGPVYVGPQPL
jgi:hypothetical protein